MRQGNQFDGVCMHGCFVRRTYADEVIVYAQVGGNFRSRLNRFVGNDDIAGTVIQNTDDRTVVHRPTRQIPHTHIGSFAIKITAFQVRQCYTNLFYFADSGHLTDFIVYIFGDIDGDITSVTFGPSFLPQISGYFGYFIHLFGQFRAIV